jgi:peptidoglycan hydrolase-like protein with peptidoglycan-binding domain
MSVVPRESRLRRLCTAGVLLAAFAATVVTAPAPAVAAVPSPSTPRRLPAAMEPLAGYVPVTSCDPRAKPGTSALGRLLVATYPGTSYGIDRTCGTSPTSEHNEGRAIDWMVSVRNPTTRAQAVTTLNWLLAKDAAGNPYANARRLGVMYIIWNNKMWRAYNPSAGWGEYQNCSKRPATSLDTTCHRDHIHISLSWEGAMARTSFWTRKVAARDYGPCRPRDLNWAAPYTAPNGTRCTTYGRVSAPAGASALLKSLTAYSGQVLRSGSSGGAVKAVQQAVRVPVDGHYGASTVKAVAAWQRAHGVTGSGIVRADTWRALLRAYKPATPVKPTTPVTPPAPPVVKPPTTPVVVKPANPLTPFKSVVLRYDSRGPAVTALQKALRVSPVSGWFGPATLAAVITFQFQHKLPVTGVVDARTWTALGA